MNVGGSKRRGGQKPRQTRSRRAPKGPKSPPSRRSSAAERLSYVIPSEMSQGARVQQEILDSVVRHGFEGHGFFAIKLALEEALANAIKHGNRLDPDKKVKIDAQVSAKRLKVTVEDEGTGFDRQHVPDPTADENLEKCSGRGILLMESYMTRVRWDRGGRRVTLLKEIK